MPGRNPILSLKQEHSMRKTKNLSAETTSVMPARKIRIIYHDPYATDSSSDEEGYSERNPKRVVREVILPSVDSVQPSKTPETETSCQGANNGAKPSTLKYRGVRHRKSGRWAAEIHDRIQGRRLWLGTFSTPEEASRAYEKKRLEIEELTNNMSEKGSCSDVKNIGSVADNKVSEDSSESVAFLISHTSPPSLLEMDCLTSAPVSASATIVRPSESVFVDESTSLAQIVPGMDFDMAFDSIVTPDEILSLDDVGLQPIDFADDVFQDLLIAGFEEQGPCSLPDFDIDFDFDFDGYNKSFDSMDEVTAPRMNVGTSLNIACL